MKLAHLLFVASLLGAPIAHAQHDHGSTKVDASAHRATGVVKAVNTEKGTVSIAHDPVASLKWPAMTMNFKPQDKRMLEQLKPGSKIAFEFQQRGRDYVITRVQ